MQSFTKNANKIVGILVASFLHNTIGIELDNITDIIKFIFDLILKHLLIVCMTWKREDRRRMGVEGERLLKERASCSVVAIVLTLKVSLKGKRQ